MKIIGTFPVDSHPAIIYPVAGLAASKNTHVKAYLDFLQTQAAKTIFGKYGFSFLVAPKAS